MGHCPNDGRLKYSRRIILIMTKRIFALILCLATLLTSFVGCASSEDDDYKGQYITMYLTENVYDLDPANAYNNEALANVVGLMFDTLFKLDENGKVKKSLVKSYDISEDENSGDFIMELRLKETYWSDGTRVAAADIVYAWKRLLEVDANYEAAALLFDIKNARAAKEGDCSIDDVGIYPSEQTLLEIRFEQEIDYDQFILNLTSVALAPLRDDIVSKSDDWAKKPGTMVCSGPFKLGRVNWKLDGTKQFDPLAPTTDEDGYLTYGENFNTQVITDFILERNAYYYRSPEEEASILKSVTPYRLCVDCSLTDEQLIAAYEAGMIMYVGDIPMSLRKDSVLAEDADVAKRSMSTNTIYLNQNAVVDDGSEEGFKLFADAKVRKALSLAIDREALAEAIVYAEAATGFIPTGVFETNSRKTMFRDACTATYEALKTDTAAAAALLDEAGIKPSKYSFELTYASYDDVHTFIAETVAAAWNELGFKVTLKGRSTIVNNDYYKYTESTPEDISDDLYAQDLRTGDFDAIILDACAFSVDPFSMLAPFAKAFSGSAMDMSDTENYQLTPHKTGYDSEDYNKLMETIFAEKDIAARADNYRAAEAMLMEDMVVIPLVFNFDATVTSSKLSKISSTYYLAANFQKTKISSYEKYIAAGKAFINENFAELKFTEAKECQYTEFEAFKTANTIYAQFYLDEKEEVTLAPAETK